MSYDRMVLIVSTAASFVLASCSSNKEADAPVVQETTEATSLPPVEDTSPAPAPTETTPQPTVQNKADMTNPLERAIAEIPPADRAEFVKSFSCYVKEPSVATRSGQITPEDIAAIHKRMQANGGKAWC